MRLSHGFWRLFLLNAAIVVGYTFAVAVAASMWQSSGDGGSSVWALTALWTLAAATIAAGVGVTWWGVREIVAPLARLTRSVQSEADAEEAGQKDGSDEVVVLSAAFSQMQRKLARRVDQIQENTEQLQTVLGSMVEGVLAVGADKSILLANEAGKRMLDFTTGEAVGRPLLEVTRARPVYEAVQLAFDSKHPVQREFEAPGLQRRTLAMRATCLPGQPSPGVVVVLHDVSELRRLENLRRELVANVSHELKTPLSAIKAYAETLRLGAVNDPEHNLNFVRRIEEQAERLHELILDILQIARIESGQESFEIVEVPLHDVLNDCMSQFDDLASAKQIALRCDLPKEPCTALADDEGLRTIVNNLIDNALKYTPAGGTVELHCRLTMDWVTIEVRDTGIGIAPGEQARVFERFYRVDKARSRELGGTGLGLSIVKHLAQAFGGSVRLESQPGNGSAFSVQLRRG